MSGVIDYYFAVGSPWAYLGLQPLRELAGKYDVVINPIPIAIIADNGAILLKNRPEARREYWLRDLDRWSAVRQRPLLLQGREQLSDATPAALLILAAINEGLDWYGLTEALQRGLWEHKEDIGVPKIRADIATAAGYDGARLLALESSPDVTHAWIANLETAKGKGIFGSPTYVYEQQPYWGQDALPFLEKHLSGHPLVAY